MPVVESTAVTKIVSGLPPSYRSFCTQCGSPQVHQQRIAYILEGILEEEDLQASYKRDPKKRVACNEDSHYFSAQLADPRKAFD